MYINKRDTFRVYKKLIKSISNVVNSNVLDSPENLDAFINQMESAYQRVIYDDLQKLLAWKKKNAKRNYQRLITYHDIVFSLGDLLEDTYKRNKGDFCDSVYIHYRRSLWLYEFNIIENPSRKYRLTIIPNKNNKNYKEDMPDETVVEMDKDDELFCYFIDRWIADHINI